MRCPRCNGLMYAMEMRDSHAMVRSAGLACILCGDIIDPIITRNRLSPPNNLINANGSRVRRRRYRRVYIR